MKPYEVLQDGRKIEILLRDENENLVLPTHVYLNKNDTFLVPAPTDRDITTPIGKTVEVWVGCYDAHYTFESPVIGEKLVKDAVCWELEKPPAMTVSDRRSFFRVKTSMPVKWQKVEPKEIEGWETLRPSSIVKLYDLSGSGLSFIYPVEIPVNSYLVFDIPLETESININTTVLGVVVRNDVHDKECRVAVHFENITKLQQHMIMQHLFSPWRRNIELSSGF
ncbi:MAG: PilZ domain-containing protein [Syntrophomonadaceae bacterium]